MNSRTSGTTPYPTKYSLSVLPLAPARQMVQNANGFSVVARLLIYATPLR
jgi:hypothetical protein